MVQLVACGKVWGWSLAFLSQVTFIYYNIICVLVDSKFREMNSVESLWLFGYGFHLCMQI